MINIMDMGNENLCFDIESVEGCMKTEKNSIIQFSVVKFQI